MELWDRFPPITKGEFFLDVVELLTDHRPALSAVAQARSRFWLPEKRRKKKNHILVFADQVWER
jgi:hypothetical protein